MKGAVIDIRRARALKKAQATIIEIDAFLAQVAERERKKSDPASSSGADRRASPSGADGEAPPSPRAA